MFPRGQSAQADAAGLLHHGPAMAGRLETGGVVGACKESAAGPFEPFVKMFVPRNNAKDSFAWGPAFVSVRGYFVQL